MILVTGATGFVGSKIMELCDGTIAAPSLRNVTENEVSQCANIAGSLKDIVV